MEVHVRECLLTPEEASHLRNTFSNQRAKISLNFAILLYVLCIYVKLLS